MPSKDVPQRLADIIDYADRIARYVGGRDRELFLADDMARDAVLRCLQCISEAAKKLDFEAERLMPNQPWKGIRGIGNPCAMNTIALRIISFGKLYAAAPAWQMIVRQP